MRLTPSQLRQDIYRILDLVIEENETVEIFRKGKKIRLVLERPQSKASRLKKHDYSDEDPEFFTHMDWTSEWRGAKK